MPVKGAGPGAGGRLVLILATIPIFAPGFAWRTIKGVKNGHSPQWLQQRLIAIGLRPINALVDITNYLTFDRGRPLHVFDADKVRAISPCAAAREGEQILGLNGKEYRLRAGQCRHRRC